MSVMKEGIVVKPMMIEATQFVHIHGVAGCDIWMDTEDAHELQLQIGRVLRQIKKG